MSVATRRTRVGDPLPSVSMQMSVEKFIAHEPKLLPAETIHSDLEAAAREGFRRPVAGGPMVMATIYRMMTSFLGEGWFRGGRTALKLTKPVYDIDFVTAKGVVTETIQEGSGLRIVCDVWVENQRRDKVIVGTASGLVP
jgi:acyl dehydratase